MNVSQLLVFCCGLGFVFSAEVFDDDSAYRWIFEDWNRALLYTDGIAALYKDQPNNGPYVTECIRNSRDRDEIRFFANANFTTEGGRLCMEFYRQSIRGTVAAMQALDAQPINVTGIEAAALAALQRNGQGFIQCLKNAPFAATDPNPGKYKALTVELMLMYQEWQRVAEESDAGPKCLVLDTRVNAFLLAVESTLPADPCAQTLPYG